ncbi:protein of unknown function [Taphrina deformans PYCC 5710]|uniref:Uncharacterized protein n=1 Tax=Taphrina deformans (strain PYCC 5710 / ATCC 11124 / CBS 356.35 / IMI 108563 / JCM 9778 / NBRC 8474) TaxID=1097556 RepID=R4XH62_TAPDE|nr:protein of unknown function [Taphrina deformans PYCC 5710]|eukprot:CCG85127.1 protein of unknown function [Taphrina deformans PYCC 5710]
MSQALKASKVFPPETTHALATDTATMRVKNVVTDYLDLLLCHTAKSTAYQLKVTHDMPKFSALRWANPSMQTLAQLLSGFQKSEQKVSVLARWITCRLCGMQDSNFVTNVVNSTGEQAVLQNLILFRSNELVATEIFAQHWSEIQTHDHSNA